MVERLRGLLSCLQTRSKCHLARVALGRRHAPAARQPFSEPVQSEEIAASWKGVKSRDDTPEYAYRCAQPQKDRVQTAGRPPTTLPRPSFTSANSVRCKIARGARLCWIRRRDATRARRICESAKSQGMVMLHSDTLTEGREGRASEALEEREACPRAAAKKC